MVFKELSGAISFLSVIPVSRVSSKIDINYIALAMYLFPLVGAIIGFAVGALAYTISFYFPSLA